MIAPQKAFAKLKIATGFKCDWYQTLALRML